MKWCFKNLLFLIVFLPGLCFGQRYTPQDVITLTDRVLSEKTDAHFIRFFKYDKNASFYEFKKSRTKMKFKIMPAKRKLRKTFTDAHIVYRFVLPYPDCQWYDTVRGTVFVDVKVDSELIVTAEPDLSFIPDFVLNYDKCHVISKERAIDVALKDDLKSGVTPPYAYLKYLPDQKKSVWVVLRTIWNNEDFNNSIPTQDDMVIVDSEIGRVIEHKVIPFAPHSD